MVNDEPHSGTAPQELPARPGRQRCREPSTGRSGGADERGLPSEHVEDQAIEEELRDSYLTYAMSTIMDRALPDVRDGLKPSQRRVLVAMNDLHLGPRTKHRKCAKIAGDTSGNYHPHGEAVVYPTLVRLGQDWNLRYPLVDPQGNFGSIDGDPPAAMRYTEARMTAVGHGDAGGPEPRHGGHAAQLRRHGRTEPTVLPGKFPNLLVNGSQGIAVGMATSIPPHNLGEICDGLVHLIDNPEATVEELMKIVKGPDFPTGGLICGRQRHRRGLHHRPRAGSSSAPACTPRQPAAARRRSSSPRSPTRCSRARSSSGSPRWSRTAASPTSPDIQDHSDRTGMRIVIELKKGADAGGGRQPALPVHAAPVHLQPHQHRPGEPRRRGR